MRPWGIEETGGRPLGEELTSGVVTPGRYDEAREKSLGKDMAGEPGRSDGGYGEGMEVALCRKSYLGLPAIEEAGGRPPGGEVTSGVITPGRHNETREKSLGKDMAGEPGRTDGGYGEGMEVALCRKSYLGLPAIEEAGGRRPGDEVTSGVITPGRYNEAREKSLGKDMTGEPGRTDGGYEEGMEVAL